MKFTTKILALASVVALLTACETAPKTGGDTSGNGKYGNNGSDTMGSLDGKGQVPDRIFFDFDSSVVNGEGQETLQKQATFLRNKGSNVTVEGHCDERGTREYNLALGERRASATKNYLVSLGVPASRVQTISYGKERPAVTGSDESAWSQNRRAVTVNSGQ